MHQNLAALSPQSSAKIKALALEHMRSLRMEGSHLSISRHIFPAGFKFNHVEKKLTVRQESVLVFADHKPRANWGHPCTYFFHDSVTGELVDVQEAIFPPSLAGEWSMEPFHTPPTGGGGVRTKASNALQAPFARYALLWTSQVSNLRHVNDLEFLWRTLVNTYAFVPSNIIVLCYDGTIGATDLQGSLGNWPGDGTPYEMIVSAAATITNLENAFATLASKLQPADLLLVHTNNHGAPTGLCVDDSTVITPAAFAQLVQSLPKHHSLIVTMEQCYSGSFQTPILGASPAGNTVFTSAVDGNKESEGSQDFDPWAELLIGALAGKGPSGAALPGLPAGPLSVQAAYNWAKAADTAPDAGPEDDPQYADSPPGCGAAITLSA